jgi:PncC family amidohydrolase
LESHLEEALEIQLGGALRKRGWKLAAAESCTGGLLGHRITNVAGSSDYYTGSITAYANQAKERLLGVKAATLERYGAVSAETAGEMARGVRKSLEAEVGISITGIAGPGGATPGKPVGLVWFGLSTPAGEWTWKCEFQGSREQVKEASAGEALRRLVDMLSGGPHAAN